MNKLRTLLTWGLLSAAAHVMGYSLTVSPIEIEAGQSTNLIINLNDAEPNFTAYQMMVYLPEGVTVQKKANGKYAYTANADRHDGEFTFTVKDAADGSVLIAVFSADKDVIAGTDGELIRLPLEVASSVTTSLQGSIKNIEFSDVNGKAYNPADVNFTMTLKGGSTPPDVSGDVTVSVPDIEMTAGSTTDLIVNMQTDLTNITAYQMMVYLPEGVTVQKKANGKYAYTANADRHDGEFTFTVKDAADGSVLIAVFSADKDVIAGTDGELIRLPLEVASSVTTSLQGSIKNIEFSDVNGKAYNPEDIYFDLIVAIDNTPKIIEDLSELSNNKQYLIHTRDKIRGTLGVIDNHLASNNPSATGPWVCRPVIPDTDNPLITNVSQLSSPNTEPTQGSLAAMIDGDASTFWHSTWSDGDVEAGSHYFQVEMPNQDDIDVVFKVVRRQASNDQITEWGVYGTNNANASKEECARLAVVTTPYTYSGETCTSDVFNTDGYRYLRFYINNTTNGRGYGHLAEFQLYPATFDETRDASPFAIIQKNDGYYLYSVRDKAFITPVNNGDESAYPLLPSDNKMNIYKLDNHFVFDFAQTGYTLNVNSNPGIAINDYGTLTDRFDDGNLFTIEEAGNFDPTEALARFNTETFTVTYEVMFDGNVVATATEAVASGSALPPVPASLDNSFVTLTEIGSHPTTITEDVTVTYDATWNGPFEFTRTLASAKWYNMHIRSGYYVSKQDTEPYYPTQDASESTLTTPAYQWAFGGDPYHVKVYNRTTGLNETLTKDDDNAVMRSGDYIWDLLPNGDGFVLRVTGTENSSINQIGGSGGPLQFWSDSKSLTDEGSTFRVVEAMVMESPNYVINDETASLSIETEESGKTVEFTHAFSGDWEALYLPLAASYDAIKADFDLAEIDGVVQNDDNNDGTVDFTVLSIRGFNGQMTTPNKPYLIRAKNAGEQTITFRNVTVYPTTTASVDCSSTSTKYEFTGSYNTLDASSLTDCYIIQNGELVKGASSLAPCRWYMTATARNGASLSLPVKICIMSVEDVITGVSPLLTSSEEEQGCIYNLAGQRLSKPQKGINIKNGKKCLVK